MEIKFQFQSPSNELENWASHFWRVLKKSDHKICFYGKRSNVAEILHLSLTMLRMLVVNKEASGTIWTHIIPS